MNPSSIKHCITTRIIPYPRGTYGEKREQEQRRKALNVVT